MRRGRETERSQYNGAKLKWGGGELLRPREVWKRFEKGGAFPGKLHECNTRLTPPLLCLSSVRCAIPTNALCGLGPFWKSEEPRFPPECTPGHVRGKRKENRGLGGGIDCYKIKPRKGTKILRKSLQLPHLLGCVSEETLSRMLSRHCKDGEFYTH